MSKMGDLRCSKCGSNALDSRSWLKRVSPKGDEGVWECAGGCHGTVMTNDERLLDAIDDGPGKVIQ